MFIAADVQERQQEIHFVGYWGNDSGEHETMPEMRCAKEAIAWGRERSDDVRIRFDGCHYWWAGRGPSPQPTEPDDEGFAGTVTPAE